MKNMTVGKKISGTTGALIALSALLGFVCLFNLSRIATASHAVSDTSVPLLHNVQTLVSAAKEQKIAMVTHIASSNPQDMASQEANTSERESEMQAALTALTTETVNESDRQMVEEYKASHQQLLGIWSKILPLSRAGKNEQAFRIWREEGGPILSATARCLARLGDSVTSQLNTNSGSSLAAAESARFWCWLLLLVSVAAGSAISFFVIAGINRTLNSAVFELGQGADQVAGAATEIAASSQSLAQGTSEQAASLEETSASSEEMTSMTRKNADNSQQCAKLMLQVDARVVSANQTLEQMVTSMKEINSSSDKISKIIKVIDEIAFQTNILALNAAVEAARAGEAGMGFAVVADEVRTLAQRSAQAAKDTAALIEESITRSNEGSAKLTQVSDAISTITASTNQVKTLVDEVNLGSQEQARGMEQIAKAIVQIERVTQQAASSSEEAASASEELTAQVGAIRSIVNQLSSMVNGPEAATANNVQKRRTLPKSTSKERPKKSAKAPSMTRSLSALKTATAAKSPVKSSDFMPQPAFAAAGKPDRNPIPMDDDFKEF